MEAIEKRFGRNAATKKTQRNLLKQPYENFTVNTPQAVNTTIGVSTVGSQVNTANIDNLSDDVIYAFLASQPSSPQHVNEELEQIHPDDLEEMDLK
nr:hypothetical protein [Tanacetum cinerariifolium]